MKAKPLSILLCMAILGACRSEDGESGTQPKTDSKTPVLPPEVPVNLTDDGVEVGGQIAAEPTTLTMTNDSKNLHRLYFAKINDDATQAEVEKALKEDPEALFSLIVIGGNFPGDGEEGGEISAGGSSELTIDFPEGNYMLLDPEVEGPPPLAFFEIGPSSGDEIEEPAADYEVELGDFYFKVQDPVSGPATVAISNAGEQSHELSVGVTKNGEEEEAGFSFAPPPGGTLWTPFDLEPGAYEAVCFLPDPKTGKPHFKLGMTQKFTVE